MRPNTDYVALHTINVGGVAGYREGDDVHADVVANLGLTVGVDVRPASPDVIPRPDEAAGRGEWVNYAVGQGADRAALDEMDTADIQARYAQPAPAGVAEVAATLADDVDVPDATVEDTLAWVGDDRQRAAAVMVAEKARDKPRASLLHPLERLFTAEG